MPAVRDITINIRGKAYPRFLKMLDESARPNAPLRRLLASRAPWERA